MDFRKMKRQKQMKFRNYYRGSFTGRSCSLLIYELASQLNRVTKEFLWWHIVGFTDQILHAKIDLEEQGKGTMNC